MSAHAEQPAHIPPEVSKMRQLERREAEVLYRWFAGDTVAQPGLHKSAAPLPPGAVRDSRLHVMERSGFRLIKPLCWDSLGDPAPQGAHEDDDWGLSFEDDGGQPTEHDIDWYLEWFWGSIARMDHTRVPFPRKAPAAAKACDADREFAGHALRHALPARWFCFRLVHDGAPGCVPRSPSEQKLWYYNFTTGESVWEPPHGLQEHAEAYERLHRFTKLRQAAEGPHLRRGSAAAGAAAAFAPDAAAVAAGQGGGLLSGHAGVSRQPSPEPLQGHGPAAAQHGHRPPPAARGGHSPHGSLTAEERHEELLRTGYGPGPEFYADPAASGGQPERRTRGATAAPDDAQHVDGAPADGTAGEEELGETESGVPGDYIRNIGIGVAVCASVGAGVGCFTATCILNHGTAGLGAAMGALTGTPLGVGAGVFVTKHDELYPPEGTEGGAAVRGQGEGPTSVNGGRSAPASGNAGAEPSVAGRRARDAGDVAYHQRQYVQQRGERTGGGFAQEPPPQYGAGHYQREAVPQHEAARYQQESPQQFHAAHYQAAPERVGEERPRQYEQHRSQRAQDPPRHEHAESYRQQDSPPERPPAQRSPAAPDLAPTQAAAQEQPQWAGAAPADAPASRGPDPASAPPEGGAPGRAAGAAAPAAPPPTLEPAEQQAVATRKSRSVPAEPPAAGADGGSGGRSPVGGAAAAGAGVAGGGDGGSARGGGAGGAGGGGGEVAAPRSRVRAAYDYWVIPGLRRGSGATYGSGSRYITRGTAPDVVSVPSPRGADSAQVPVGVLRTDGEPSPRRSRSAVPMTPRPAAAGSSSCALPLPGEHTHRLRMLPVSELTEEDIERPVAYLLAPAAGLPPTAHEGEAFGELCGALIEGGCRTLIWDGSAPSPGCGAGALLPALAERLPPGTRFVALPPPGADTAWASDREAAFGDVTIVATGADSGEAHRAAARRAGGRGDWHCFGGDQLVATTLVELMQDLEHKGSPVWVYNLPSAARLRELLGLPPTGTARGELPDKPAEKERILHRLWEEVKELAEEGAEVTVEHTGRAVDWVQEESREGGKIRTIWDDVKDGAATAASHAAPAAQAAGAGAASAAGGLREHAASAAESAKDLSPGVKDAVGGWLAKAKVAAADAHGAASAAASRAAEQAKETAADAGGAAARAAEQAKGAATEAGDAAVRAAGQAAESASQAAGSASVTPAEGAPAPAASDQ